MKIQYASDLHLEFTHNRQFMKANPLIANGDILLLAGDIVPFGLMKEHDDFFNYVSDHFKATYWIPGNHEYYGFDLASKCGTLNENIRSNVYLINNSAIKYEDVTFIFSTLWSKISVANQWKIEHSMNDFRVIKYKGHRLSIKEYNQLHEDSFNFVTTELSANKNNGKTVVVTHHVPTFKYYPEQYKGDALNEAFAIELSELIEATLPDYWIYGHHHTNTPDFKIGNTQLLTNQLGYVQYGEHKSFSPNKTLSLW